MDRPWLILDCNFLAYRANWIFGDLSHNGAPTGAIYGFLKDVVGLARHLATNRLIFCWDVGESKRKQMFSWYKSGREDKDLSEEEIRKRIEFRLQMNELRTCYLPKIGFRNIFWQDGYESDDIMASICETIKSRGENGIIVTADQDLFQCLCSEIRMYNPISKVTTTVTDAENTLGISVKSFPLIKAMTGCKSDSIPGISGIGEKKAVAYLYEELGEHTKAWKSIQQNWKEIVERNLSLVTLPLPGTNTFELSEDELNQEAWLGVTEGLGMKSLASINIEEVLS